MPGPNFNLETAVGPRQKVQDFESESLTIGVEHSQKVKATPSVSDYGSKDCAFCPDPTAGLIHLFGQFSTLFKFFYHREHREHRENKNLCVLCALCGRNLCKGSQT